MRKTLETTQFFAELGQKLFATKKMYPGSKCELLTDSGGETAHDIKDTVYRIETIMQMIELVIGKSKRNDPVTDTQEGDSVVIVRGLTGRVSVTLQIYTRNESGVLQLKRVYEGASEWYETRIVFEAEPIPLPATSTSKGTDMNNAKTVDFKRFVQMIDDSVTNIKAELLVNRVILVANGHTSRVNEITTHLTQTLSASHDLKVALTLEMRAVRSLGDIVIEVGDVKDCGVTPEGDIAVTVTPTMSFTKNFVRLAGKVTATGDVEITTKDPSVEESSHKNSEQPLKESEMSNVETVDFNRFVEMVNDTVTKCKGRKKTERCMPVMPLMYGAPGQGFVSMMSMPALVQPGHLYPTMVAPGQPLMFPQPTTRGLYGQGLNTASSPSRTIVLVNYESDRVNEIVSGLAKTLTKTHSLWVVTSVQGLTPLGNGDIFISIGGSSDKPNESVAVWVTEFVDDRGHVCQLSGTVKSTGEVDIIANRTADRPDAKPEVGFTQTKDTTDDFIESNLKRLQLAVAKVGANLYIFMEMNGYERKINMTKSVDVETLSPDSFGTLVSKAEAFIAVVEKAGYRIVLTLTAMVEDTNTPSRNRKHCFTNS